MRLRTANNRKARRKRAATTGVPFCYLEYAPNFEVVGSGRYSGGNVSLRCVRRTKQCVPGMTYIGPPSYGEPIQRSFSDYGQAITHLTKLKLSLCEEDKDYKEFTPCKIVEGYAKKEKQIITKVTELPGVSNSVQPKPRSATSRKRQFQQQRQYGKSLSQTVDGWTVPIWYSGPTTGSSTTTTVGGTGNGAITVSVSNGGTTFSS